MPAMPPDHFAFSYQTAAALLEIGARHLRRLVELGAVESIGRGHFKKITGRSIRDYQGAEKEKRL